MPIYTQASQIESQNHKSLYARSRRALLTGAGGVDKLDV